MYSILIAAVMTAFLVSFTCSLLEAAYLSITPSQLADIHQRNQQMGKMVAEQKEHIEKTIAVVLISNTAAHTIGAAIAGAQFDNIFGDNWLWLFSLIFTIMMVQYTELLPKSLGVHFNRQVVTVAARPLQAMVFIMNPIIKMVYWFNRPFEFRPKDDDDLSTTDEINALASMARSSREITSRQERIIRAVPRLSQQPLSEVMIPLEKISFISSAQTINEALNNTYTEFHTRYPVCKDGNRNEVIGYVNFKEMVAALRSNPQGAKLSDIIRPISFAMSDDSAENLLEKFATQNVHMAMIRDENGRSLGLVTLEDIVEELIGDLDDEFDPLPRTFYSPGDNFWVVGGGNPLTMVARESRLDLPKRMEPLSIWFTRVLGHTPRVGDIYRYNNIEFYVRKVRRGRALEFNVRKSS
ncbi:MAG: hemolysin family protein [Lentisphaeria bacterium]|nr:hemolysin family protein [Lentisphaeria bacterium]